MSHHRACGVYLCQAFEHDKVVSYFSFPKDPKRCELWVNACRNKHIEYFYKNKGPEYMHRRYKICSKHFKHTDFRNPNLTSQGLIPSAIPTLKLKAQFSTKTKKIKTKPTKDDNEMNTSNMKKPFFNENNTVSDVSTPQNVTCNINPLLIASTIELAKLEKNLKSTEFDIPNVCKLQSNLDNIVKNCHRTSTNKTASLNSPTNKQVEIPKKVDVLQKKLEASHNILINTQKENLSLKRQLSKVKMIIKNHETRYDCLAKRINKFKKQISRLREEKKKLILDNKKCLISKYIDSDLEKKKCLRYSETDKFFSLSLYLCSKYVYKSMQKHFLLPSICSINEWLQDTNLVEECKKKIPETEMFPDNETDVNNSSELIELKYIDVALEN